MSFLISANQEDDPELYQVPEIDLHAVHLRWAEAAAGRSLEGPGHGVRAAQLVRRLDEMRRGLRPRPLVVSTDGAPADRQLLAALLDQLPGDGSIVFEHFDQNTSRGLQRDRLRRRNRWEAPGLRRRASLLARSASELAPRGRLAIADGQTTWNGRPVRLRGLSPTYGALTTRRHDPVALAHWLHRAGVNFTRLWCVEQWTSQASDLAGVPGWRTSLAPWRGTGPPARGGEPYDLEVFEPLWFERLEAFFEATWDLGVVVQLSLFDWAGLRNLPERGRWRDHPFNSDNHRGQWLDEPVAPGDYPRGFTTTTGPLWRVVERFVTRVGEIARRFGHVILEIANEPRGLDPPAERYWHQAVAQCLRAVDPKGGSVDFSPRAS